ncbi:MAG: FecR domain-containing protein [Elusimicrobiota bacterium]
MDARSIPPKAYLAGALALAAGLLCGSRVAAAADRPVQGVAVAVEGAPQLKRPDSPKPVPLDVGMFLRQGDVVETRRGDLASLALLSGVEIRLNEKTVFEVKDGGTGSLPAVVAFKIGQVWTRMLHRRAQVRIGTPLAVVSVRGTEVDAAISGRLDVKVYEGHADVFNEHGRQALTAGQVTRVASAADAPEAPRKMGKEDREVWQKGIRPKRIERLLERAQKMRRDQKELELKLRYKKGGKKKTFRFKLREKKK